MQARMSDEFLDAIDWQKLKKENDEALQKIESERRQLDQERSEVEYEKGRVYWEQEEERRRLYWEWSQLNDAKVCSRPKNSNLKTKRGDSNRRLLKKNPDRIGSGRNFKTKGDILKREKMIM